MKTRKNLAEILRDQSDHQQRIRNGKSRIFNEANMISNGLLMLLCNQLKTIFNNLKPLQPDFILDTADQLKLAEWVWDIFYKGCFDLLDGKGNIKDPNLKKLVADPRELLCSYVTTVNEQVCEQVSKTPMHDTEQFAAMLNFVSRANGKLVNEVIDETQNPIEYVALLMHTSKLRDVSQWLNEDFDFFRANPEFRKIKILYWIDVMELMLEKKLFSLFHKTSTYFFAYFETQRDAKYFTEFKKLKFCREQFLRFERLQKNNQPLHIAAGFFTEKAKSLPVIKPVESKVPAAKKYFPPIKSKSESSLMLTEDWLGGEEPLIVIEEPEFKSEMNLRS